MFALYNLITDSPHTHSQKLDDTTPLVREAAQEALGTMLRVVGDRPMNQYLEGVDKGKMAKVQYER